MRRLFASLMVVVMLVMCIQPCFAATIETTTAGFPNPASIDLNMSVSAKKSSGDYTDGVFILNDYEYTTVDYKATLDMSPIRELFTKTNLWTDGDSAALEEFEEGAVETTITVVVTYPEGANVVAELETAGGLLGEGIIFSESSERTVDKDNRKVTVKFKNKDNLKVADLMGDGAANSSLADVVFELPGSITYSKAGTHTVNISMTGNTVITFDTKTQTVNYTAAASHIVNYTVKEAVAEHHLKVVPAKAATCLAPGYTESVICDIHDSYECEIKGIVPKQVVPQKEHTPEVMGSVATCTTDGFAGGSYCSVCGTVISYGTVTKKLGHDFSGIPTDVVIETCTTAGRKTYTCKRSDCNQTYTVSVPALDHYIKDTAAKAATCETAGNTAGQVCTRESCKAVLKVSTTIPATGHDYGEWSVTKEATETETGTKERVCKNDSSHKDTVTIPKLVHTCSEDSSATVTVLATCTTAGSIQKYCGCGKPFGSAEVVPATGHSSEKGHVAAVASTCSSKGIMEHWSCTSCGKLFKDEARTQEVVNVILPLDSTKHDEVTLAAVASTCTTHGLTEGKKCKLCNVVTNQQQQTALASHTFNTVTAITATCTSSGIIEHKQCSVCNAHYANDGTTKLTLEGYTADPLEHKYIYTSETKSNGDVTTTVTCERLGCTYNDVYTMPHEHGVITKEIITTQPTCTTTGMADTVCISCGETILSHSVPVKAHNLIKVDAVLSTCKDKGYNAYWYCKDCYKMFSDEKGTVEISKIPECDLIPHPQESLIRTDDAEYLIDTCGVCGDKIKTKKLEIDSKSVEVNDVGNILKDEQKELDNTKKEAAASGTGFDVVFNKIIDVIETVISNELNEEVEKPISNNKPNEEKIVLDIKIERVIEYINGNEKVDEEKEIIDETAGLIEIIIPIPSKMQGKKDYAVHRMHKNKATNKDEYQRIGTYANDDGEYIVIESTQIKLYVKKFSEYAVVSYDETVNVDPTPSYNGGGGGSSLFTVRFHANGGTVVESVKVNKGKTVTEPTTTRDGYIFDGWYIDSAFTEKFDFSTPIKSSLNLYAKWIEDGSGASDTICNKFVDIDIDEWYHAGVHYAIENGIMNGTGTATFEPETNVSRAMLVTVLWRAEDEPLATEDCAFVDLEDGQYYVDAVKWANENGVVTGTTVTTFAPDNAITREQFAAIMFRYAKLKGFDVSVGENTNILSYTDFDKISEYAIPAMQYAVGSGLLKGKTATTLNPIDNATRAEMATILYRFFNANK